MADTGAGVPVLRLGPHLVLLHPPPLRDHLGVELLLGSPELPDDFVQVDHLRPQRQHQLGVAAGPTAAGLAQPRPKQLLPLLLSLLMLCGRRQPPVVRCYQSIRQRRMRQRLRKRGPRPRRR